MPLIRRWFNETVIDVMVRMGNYMPHKTMDMGTNPCIISVKPCLVKWTGLVTQKALEIMRW